MRDFGRPNRGVVESFCQDCGLIQDGKLYYSSCEVCHRVFLEAVIVHCTPPCAISWHLRLLFLRCPRSSTGLNVVPAGCSLAWFTRAHLDSGNDPDGSPCC